MNPGPDVPTVLTLDTLGRKCPAPIIELARHIGDVEPGQVVAVLSDDPAAALDVPAWCELRAHEYLGAGQQPVGTAYYVRRAPTDAVRAPTSGP